MMSWSRVTTRLNAFFVTAYKVLGFVALTAILLMVGAYFLSQATALLNRRWVAPTIVSSSDEHILRLRAQIAEESATCDRLASERAEVQVRLRDVERTIASKERLLQRMRRGLENDLASATHEQLRLSALAESFRRSQARIASAHEAYAAMSERRVNELFAAHLINGEDYVAGNQQLAQIARSDLDLEATRLDVERRLSALSRRNAAMRQLLGAASSRPEPKELTYDTALVEQELDRTERELQQARDMSEMLTSDVEGLDRAAQQHAQVLAALQRSPLVRALGGQAILAFVPYENLEDAGPGTALYGCSLELVWCRPVGHVLAVLEGEVSGQNPINSRPVRGVLMEIALDERTWGQSRVLYAGKAPLL